MKTSTRHLRLPILTAMILAASLPTVRGATKTYFGADNGVWVANGNWNPAVTPVTIDDVFLGSHSAGTTDLHVTYNETGSVPLTSVTLNSTGISGFMIVNQTSASSVLNTISLNIGSTVISNTWNQSAGFVSATTLNLGVGINSTGNSYNLSGTGQINGEMNLGVSGSGVFNQTGGTHNINNGIGILGVNAGSSGTYNLFAGTLAGSPTIRVGQNGTGLFTQTGGTAVIGYLFVGTQSGTGTYNMSGGTLDTGLGGIAVGGSSGTAAFNLSNGTATVTNSNNNTSVVVGLNGTFNLLTAGTLNANITVNSGGVFNLQNGGTVDADSVNNQTTALVTVNTGGLFALQGGTFNLAPTIVMGGGTFRLNGHSLTATSLSGASGILESAAGNAVLTLSSGTGNFSGTIRDGASSILSVLINGAGGQHTFSGSNTFTGSTTVSAGTLLAGSTSGFSSSSAFVVNGGVAMANGFNVAVPSLSGTGGTLDVGNGSFTVGSNGNSTTFSGLLAGGGIFDKVGNGQLTLNGGGSFAGQITVHAGSLRTTAANGLPTSATVTLSTLGTALNVNASQALAGLNGGSLTSVNFAGASTLTIGGTNGNSNYSGAFTGIGTLVKTGGGNFTVGNGPADTVSGNTDTGLGFTASAGTLTLNKADGTNAVAGPLVVSGGTVQFQSGNQIADNSPVTINGGNFNLGANSETVGNLAGTGGTINQGGGTFTVTQTGAATFNGALTGTGAFVKTGAADLTLTFTGTYGGSITASFGRLILQSQVGGTGLTALGGGTVQLNNATATLGGNTIQAFLGGVAEYLGATVNNGFLRGPGTHTILSGGGASSFTSVTTFNSTVLTQNGAATFTNFTNGGTLNNNAAATFNGGTNASSGVINVASTLNTKDFTSNGVINVPNGGTVSNTVSSLVLGGGSRTFIGSVATPGGTISTAAGTSIELNGGLLVNNGTQNGTLNINFGGLAKGSGLFGAVSVTDGGKFSPGNSPGTATVSGLTFASGGNYQFELNSANATPGSGMDFINDLGVLDITAAGTPGSAFTIALVSLNGANQPAALTDFDPTQPFSAKLVSAAGGITGFAANEFTVDTSAFANSLQGGAFSVAQQGGDLVLNFSPSTVPEPTTCALLVGGLALLGLRRTRRASGRGN